MSEVPEIEGHMIKSTDKIGGIGEPGVPPLAPAVANSPSPKNSGKRYLGRRTGRFLDPRGGFGPGFRLKREGRFSGKHLRESEGVAGTNYRPETRKAASCRRTPKELSKTTDSDGPAGGRRRPEERG